jgi:type IV secretion system protein VirB9
MRFARILALAAAALMLTGAAYAQDLVPRDPRLRVVPYAPDQVVAIDGRIGYQMMIEFEARERIETVSIGDSIAWQVTPNRAATLLFLKPTEAHAATNMIVVTTQRRYVFALRAGEATGPDDPRIIYSLRFTYPEEGGDQTASQTLPDPASLNFDYASSGSDALAPARVFDDGRFTYFEMAEGADTPAIFVLNRHGEEEVVNSQVRGAYTVVDVIADAFVLRYGRDRTVVRSGRAEADETPPQLRRRRGRRS